VSMPVYAGITSLAFFAALGLPGMSSFVSEVLVFIGAFTVYPTVTAISALGIVLTAGYLLWTLQRMFLGPENEKYSNLPEIGLREIVTLAPLAVIVIVLGIYPMPLLDLISTSMANLIHVLGN